MRCIWCKKNKVPFSIEHIIPEAMGCPEGFTLANGEVCQKCNSRLGSIDKALVHDFEISTFIHGIRGKKGKLPKISTIPNLKTEYEGATPTYHMNMGKYPIYTSNGQKISPYTKNSNAIKVNFKQDIHTGSAQFTRPLGKHKKFNRALTKIALSSIAYFCGADLALNSHYDHIRNYVLFGGPIRPILFLTGDSSGSYHEVSPPFLSNTDDSHFIRITLARIVFSVDLSPNLVNFKKMLEHLKCNEEFDGCWGVIPANQPL